MTEKFLLHLSCTCCGARVPYTIDSDATDVLGVRGAKQAFEGIGQNLVHRCHVQDRTLPRDQRGFFKLVGYGGPTIRDASLSSIESAP